MTADAAHDIRRQLTDFMEGFHHAVVEGEEDLDVVVDRFHTPDMVQVSDGHAMDRDTLLAHVRTVRRTRPRMHLEMLDALGHEGRIAARYVMHVTRTRGDRTQELAIEVHEFARFTPDGRLARAHTLTRTEKTS